MSEQPLTWSWFQYPPDSVLAVRDEHGQLWRRADDPRCWVNGDTIWFWETLLRKRGPLTEEGAAEPGDKIKEA